MVTSTSTPGSSEMEVWERAGKQGWEGQLQAGLEQKREEGEGKGGRTICLTTSDEALRSIRRLWIFISKQSQVLEPSPQGVLRVVILRTLVGMRTGPLTRRSLSLARLMRSVETGEGRAAGQTEEQGEGPGTRQQRGDVHFSRFLTLREVSVWRRGRRRARASKGGQPSSFLARRGCSPGSSVFFLNDQTGPGTTPPGQQRSKARDARCGSC